VLFIKNVFEPIDEAKEKFKDALDRTLVLFVPIIDIFKTHGQVPKKPERVEKLQTLIRELIKSDDFVVKLSVNKINGENNYE